MCFILTAVFILFLPLVKSLYAFMLLLALYGTTVGSAVSHFPLLILRYVDKNLQYVAMGCEGFLSGIVSFALPSMIGKSVSMDVMYFLFLFFIILNFIVKTVCVTLNIITINYYRNHYYQLLQNPASENSFSVKKAG